jgi:hypothetical protein
MDKLIDINPLFVFLRLAVGKCDSRQVPKLQVLCISMPSQQDSPKVGSNLSFHQLPVLLYLSTDNR